MMYLFYAFVSIVLLMGGTIGCTESESTAFDQNPAYSSSTPSTSSTSESLSLCDEASAYVQECIGHSVSVFDAQCNGEDAEFLLQTPCDVLTTASDIQVDLKADGLASSSFTCLLLGVGCPPDQGCYTPLSEEATQAVIDLSNPNTLGDEYDVRLRIEEIAGIFKEERDPRGIFAIVYRLITNNAVASVEDGLYEHPEWTRALIVAFAKRYLVNLHGHFTGGEMSVQWKKYYKLAQNCQVGYGRTLGVAIATHLMVDLPYALEDVNSIDIHEEDFILFGEVSLRIFPDLIRDMQTVYNTDVSDLLKGFFLGEWIDSIYTKGTATTFIYQTVRINAWRNNQNLLTFPRWMVDADISTGWGLADVFLATLDAAEIL
jgi:hypothetical protein